MPVLQCSQVCHRIVIFLQTLCVRYPDDVEARALVTATRAEKRYMKDGLTFPFNNWNYGHNRNYLSYIRSNWAW